MIDERQVREMLERRAETISATPADAPKAIRRARRRLALNATVGAVMALAVVAGAAAGLRMTQPTPAPVKPATPPSVSVEPSPDMPPPFTERFDSPLHGLSIGYPSGWRTRAAIEPWGRGELAFGASDVDVIFHPTLRDDLYFALVSEPPPKSEARRGQVVQSLPPPLDICHVGGVTGSYDIPDPFAEVGITTCGGSTGSAGGHYVQVATTTRVYFIYLHVADDPLLQATYDRDWFEAALETVDLRPEDALNPSESP